MDAGSDFLRRRRETIPLLGAQLDGATTRGIVDAADDHRDSARVCALCRHPLQRGIGRYEQQGADPRLIDRVRQLRGVDLLYGP